jgi:integration host factor subunit beta
VIKSELILRLAGRNPHLHPRDAEKIVDAVLDEIVTALARGDRIELRGLGAFTVKVRQGRIGRNPKTGVTVQVSEKKIPYFRQSQKMGHRLNPGETDPEQTTLEANKHLPSRSSSEPRNRNSV